MTNVIRFLEGMGAAAPLPPEQVAAAIAALNVGDAERQALLDRDVDALSGLLGGRQVMRCAIYEPMREPDQQPDQDRPDEPEEGDTGKEES